jgi:transcriptional regulator with XRE-family HTH domain
MSLESVRKARGLSQEQLARELGLRSKGYISDIESGRQRASLKLALKIEKWSDGQVKAADLCPADADLLTTVPPTTAGASA